MWNELVSRTNCVLIAVFRYQMDSEEWHQRSFHSYHWKEN